MKIQRGQRGEANIGCILWAVVLIVVGMLLWKAVPAKIANAELYDYMVELTKFSARRNEDFLKKQILEKAQELNLPVTKKQVTVEKNSERIKMRCTYTVVLEWPFYTYEWKVDHRVDRPIYQL